MNRVSKTVIGVLGSALLVFAITGCGGDKPAENKQPIDTKNVPGNVKVLPGGLKENPPQ